MAVEAYTPLQWLLIFFVYSVLGWVWESCYVSVKSKRWVNRGFLHGPWLPIYGSGAVVVLLVTLPARGRPALIFLLGMIGATVLEYVTGESMEKLFHMRYWDYSDKPLNVNGHICLGVSIGWGVFSLVLLYVLHPPVEDLVLWLPVPVAQVLALCLTAAFAVDTTWSVQKALDTKHLLASLSETSRRLAVVQEKLRDAAKELELDLESKLPDPKQALQRAAADGESKKAYLLHKLQERRDSTNGLLDRLNEKNRAALAQVSVRLAAVGDDRKERKRLENLRTFLLGVRDSLAKTQQEVYARRDKDYQRAVDLLYRNPTATSRQHAGAFRLLKSLKKERKTKS